MSEVRGGGQDKLPHAGGQGTAKRSYHRPEVRSGSREELPYVQGVAAMQAQESRKELLHVQGQEGRL